jgi:hypothetical protein
VPTSNEEWRAAINMGRSDSAYVDVITGAFLEDSYRNPHLFRMSWGSNKEIQRVYEPFYVGNTPETSVIETAIKSRVAVAY